MTGYTARAVVQLHALERLAYLERAADESPGGRVADAVEIDIAFGIDDAALQLIDLRYVQRQRLQVCPLSGEELAAAGVQFVAEGRIPLLTVSCEPER